MLLSPTYKMRRKSYIALHKSEWDRLHRRTDERNPQLSDERDAYFRRLVEISQAWIKTWPDTVQGHVEQIKKEKQKHHQDETALVKSFLNSKKKEGTTEAVKKAKQLIFENSCYGKQLRSALLESKTLEERDVQIEFQKELKLISQDQEKEAVSKINFKRCSFELDKREDEKKIKKNEMEMELAKINQSIYEMEMCKKNKEKKEQEKLGRENARLMQELLDNEKRQEKEYENHLRKDVELYEREQKIARQRKIEREKIEEEIANAERKQLDKKYCEIRRVLREMHHDTHNTERFKRNYELVKEIQEKEEKRYHEFVQKGVKNLEDRTAQEQQEEILKQKLESNKRKMISKFNKTEAENAEKCRVGLKRFNWCVGDRQSILPKSCYCCKKNTNSGIEEKQPTNFLVPAKKFQEQLEARKKEPSPWTGLSATHAQFAQQAGLVLQEARHKQFARKVVNHYRKTNLLDATTLPVPNYD